jgi:hypothetical protein
VNQAQKGATSVELGNFMTEPDIVLIALAVGTRRFSSPILTETPFFLCSSITALPRHVALGG